MSLFYQDQYDDTERLDWLEANASLFNGDPNWCGARWNDRLLSLQSGAANGVDLRDAIDAMMWLEDREAAG